MHPFLKGLVVGILTGAAVGLLVAPGKGTENREFVRLRVQQALAAGRQAAQEQDQHLRARFRQTISPVKEKEPEQR